MTGESRGTGSIMRISLNKIRGVTIVSIIGAALDESNVDDFLEQVDPLHDANTQFILDLWQLEFVGAAGLGAFDYLFNRIRGSNGRVCLLGADDEVMTAVRLVHLDRIMNVWGTLDEAIASFEDRQVVTQGA